MSGPSALVRCRPVRLSESCEMVTAVIASGRAVAGSLPEATLPDGPQMDQQCLEFMKSPEEMPMPKPTIDPLIMKRLAFIQMLYQQGIDQSHLPEPLNAASMLTLHDASELFLVLASEKLGTSLPRMVPFMDYWKRLSPDNLPGGVALSAQQGMERLNDLRNGLKHRGTLPSTAAIDQACGDVHGFLEDNTLAVFGIPFTDIDMAEVIPQPAVRDKVRAASTAAASGDRVEGVGLLAEAYYEMFGAGGMPVPRDVPRFGVTVTSRLSDSQISAILWQPPDVRVRRPAGGAHTLAEQIGKVTHAVEEMQQGLRVMALGIDYRQFYRFKVLTPDIVYFVDGHSERHSIDGYSPTSEEFEYCRQFIITVALRMAELEAHSVEPSWMSTI